MCVHACYLNFCNNGYKLALTQISKVPPSQASKSGDYALLQFYHKLIGYKTHQFHGFFTSKECIYQCCFSTPYEPYHKIMTALYDLSLLYANLGLNAQHFLAKYQVLLLLLHSHHPWIDSEEMILVDSFQLLIANPEIYKNP